MKQVYTNHSRLPNENWQHDFDLIEEDDVKFLMRSNNSTSWTDEFKGIESARLKDTGNGLIAIFGHEKKIELGYDQAEELFILLSQCEYSGI